MKIVSSSWIKFDINWFKFREKRAEAGRCAQKNESLGLGVQLYILHVSFHRVKGNVLCRKQQMATYLVKNMQDVP